MCSSLSLFIYVYCLAHTSIASTHTYTYDVRTHAHAHTHTHVNMYILTNKRSSIYIQTVFFLACFLYCKGGNLYCMRVAPLYLFCIFLFLYVHLIYMPVCFSLLNTFYTCSVLLWLSYMSLCFSL